MLRRARRPLTSLAGLLAVSCLPGGKLSMSPVTPTAGRGLSLTSEAASGSGPLALAFASPSGVEVEAPLPTFVFTRAMHRLGDPPDQPAVDATFDPPVPGSWRWIDSRTLQFSPSQGFAPATPYRMSLRPPASLDGQHLDAPVSLEFTTPRLALAAVSLGDDRHAPLRLDFNQDVAPARVLASLKVLDDEGHPVALRVLDPAENRPEPPARRRAAGELPPSRRVELRPVASWPPGKLALTIATSLRGEGGPLGLVADATRSLREPERVVVRSLRCTDVRLDGQCATGSKVELELSTALPLASVRKLLTVSPPLPLELRSTSEEPGPSSSFEVRAAFKQGVAYTLAVKPTTGKRWRGQPVVDEGASLAVRPLPPSPTVEVLARGTYLLPTWTPRLEARLDRVERASLTVTPLDVATIAAMVDGHRGLEGFDALVHPANEARRELTSTTPRMVVGLGDLMPGTLGPMLIEGRWEGGGEKGTTRRLVQRTDLAMTTSSSPDTVLVWVSHLSTGEPAPGAVVTARSASGREVTATANDEGFAELAIDPLDESEGPRHRGARYLLTARVGDDWLYDHVEVSGPALLDGLLYTDRDLYRPGETVHVKGVVRQPSVRGLEPPVGHPVTVSMQIGGGSPVVVTKTLSSWGTFAHDFVIPEGAPPREVIVEAKDGSHRISWHRVEIHHERPASFRVQAALDRPHYLAGEPVTCTGTAAYLYGGSMGGTRGTIEMSLQSSGNFGVPGLPGYRVGLEGGSYESRLLATASQSLDDTRPWQVRKETSGIDRPTEVYCETQVTDDGQQTMRGGATSWVHPAALYAAVQASSYPDVGSIWKPDVLAVTPTGEIRETTVRLSLHEKRARGEGPALSVCDVHTGPVPASCGLPVPPHSDRVYQLRATVTDDTGRRATTTFTMRPQRPARPMPSLGRIDPADVRRIEPPLLSVEYGQKTPGGSAHVTLAPERPFRRALVTVEREGLFLKKLLGPGQTTTDFAVTPAMAPEVTVSVHGVTPVPTEPRYDGLERFFQQSERRLEVALGPRDLAVEVHPSRTEGTPGDEVDVDVAVTDGGKPAAAEVTLYAVDEGILELTHYRTPELAPYMAPGGEHLVRSSESRRDLGWLLSPDRLHGDHMARAPSVRMGATMVNRPETPLRSDFNPTPLFAPSLETDASGHVHARFKLPDSLTSYRVMAVAVGRAEHYGQDEKLVQVRLPAQIRPVFPQVVRAGDRFEAAAVVANNTDHPLDLLASLSTEGALAGGVSSSPLHLGAGESRRVTFATTASRVGPGKLTARLTTTTGEVLDGVVIPVPVEAPVTLEASATSGSTSGAVDEPLVSLATLRPDAGQLDLTVSTTPIAGLAVGLEQLLTYPYGCTEQTVSRLVPMLVLRDLSRGLGVALPDDIDSVSRQSVDRLLGHRDSHGRFGLWPHSTPTPWLTTYGYWGLGEAARRGVPVDDEVMATGRHLLSDAVSHWADGPDAASEACFALDVVASLPGAATAHARTVGRQLLGQLDSLPLAARAHLLHALVTLGVDETERASLVRSIEASLHVDGPTARAVEATPSLDRLDSSTRTTALVLRALVSAAPSHPLREPLARALVADRGPRGWRTTQETTWALLALDAFARSLPPLPSRLDVSVALGPRSLLAAPLAGVEERTVHLPLADLASVGPSPLRIETHGGQAFYQVRLRYAPATAPVTPLAAGFELSKSCAPVDRSSSADAPLVSTTSFTVGQWVRCELVVSTASLRRFVAIDDPVAAGLELADPRLQSTPGWVRSLVTGVETQRELSPGRVVIFRDDLPAGVHRWTYVARATTAGDFSAPPARVDEMYTPETFARTAAQSVHIAPLP